jgi:hypothetical protein
VDPLSTLDGDTIWQILVFGTFAIVTLLRLWRQVNSATKTFGRKSSTNPLQVTCPNCGQLNAGHLKKCTQCNASIVPGAGALINKGEDDRTVPPLVKKI